MKKTIKKVIASLVISGLLFTGTNPALAASSTEKETVKVTVTQAKTIDQLVNYAKSLKGTKYKEGGTSTKGFDSSGFVQHVYGKYEITVPRTTEKLAALGTDVSLKKLKAGDLVFFDTAAKKKKVINFVGIYLGKNEFISVSSKKGVNIQSLKATYWSTAFVKAKRVVTVKAAPTTKAVALNAATVKGFKEGTIKEIPFSLKKPLTMKMVKKTWGEPVKIVDNGDIKHYVYTKNGQEVRFIEDKTKNVYMIIVKVKSSRADILKQMKSKPSVNTKEFIGYKVGDFYVSFDPVQTSDWWVAIRKDVK